MLNFNIDFIHYIETLLTVVITNPCVFTSNTNVFNKLYKYIYIKF